MFPWHDHVIFLRTMPGPHLGHIWAGSGPLLSAIRLYQISLQLLDGHIVLHYRATSTGDGTTNVMHACTDGVTRAVCLGMGLLVRRGVPRVGVYLEHGCRRLSGHFLSSPNHITMAQREANPLQVSVDLIFIRLGHSW